MPTCPHGHQSQTADYCDFCGMPMGAPTPTPTAGLPMCPICSTPRTGQYCEECGYNWDLAPAGAGGGMRQQPAPPMPGAQQGLPQPPVSYQPPAPAPLAAQAPAPPAPGQQAPVFEPPGYQVPGSQATPPPVPSAPGADFGGYGGYVTGDTSGAGTEYFLAPPMGSDPTGQSGRPQPGTAPSGPDYGHPQPGGPAPVSAPPPAPAPARRGTWIAVVTADREYFNDMMARSGPEAGGLYFPPFSPERRVPMTGQGQLRIGRRSHQRGTVPEIDLSIAPEDPGASHQHALLQEQPDGSWVVIDQDSTNGTTLNGAAESLSPFVPVELHDGDRIHVGAWTTITVHCA